MFRLKLEKKLVDCLKSLLRALYGLNRESKKTGIIDYELQEK